MRKHGYLLQRCIGSTIPLLALSALLVLASCGGGGVDKDPAAPAPQPPNSAPTNVRLMEVGSSAVGAVSASWLPAADDTTPEASIRYQLHASTEEAFIPSPATLRLETTGLLSGTIDQGLTPGERYFVRLVALDAQGLSAVGTPLSVNVADTAAGTVAGTSSRALSAQDVSAITDDSVTLSAGTPAPEVGSFIASDEAGGYLRRVTGVSTVAGQTVLATGPAALSDVFSELQVSSAVRMGALSQRQGSAESARPLGVTISSAPGLPARWDWAGSRFSYMAGPDATQPAADRRRALLDRGVRSTPDFKVSGWSEQSGKWGKVSGSANVLLEESAKGSIKIDYEALGTGSPWLGSPVTLCSLDVVGVTHGDPSAPIRDLSVGLLDSFLVSVDGVGGQVLKGSQRLEIHALAGTANALPYRVKLVALLEDIDSDCKPPSFNPFAWRLGGWRETLELEILVYVGSDVFPSQEVQHLEFNGTATASAKLKVSNEVEFIFDPELRSEFALRRGRLQHAEFTVAARPIMIEQTLRIDADARGTLSGDVPLIQPRRFFKVFVTTAGVPVTVSGEFSARLLIEGEITGALQATEQLRVGFEHLEYGIRCTGFMDCVPIEKSQPVLHLSVGGEGDARAELTLTVVPRLEVRIYEAIGGTLTLDPSLTAKAGVQGHVVFEAAVDPDEQALATRFDADYRLTAAELDARLNAYVFAELTVLDSTWRTWPDGAKASDYKTHRRLPVADTRVAGLPALSAIVDMVTVRPDDLAAIRVELAATDVPNPLQEIFPNMPPALISWQRWTPAKLLAPLGVPNGSYTVIDPLPGDPGAVWVRFTEPGTYVLRVGGFSDMGAWARQYTDVEVAVTDSDGNGILDHVGVRDPSAGVAVDSAACDVPVVGEPMLCTVVGTNLPQEIRITATNCAPSPMSPSGFSSSERRAYSCTPITVDLPVEVSTSLLLSTGEKLLIPTLTAMRAPIYAVGSDGALYRVDPRSSGIDTAIGRIRTESGSHVDLTDLAQTRDGRLFGITFTMLFEIDSATAVATPIGSGLGYSGVNALASDAGGNLYAGSLAGQLLSVNSVTGRATLIGHYGSSFSSAGDLAFSPTGILYAAVTSPKSGRSVIVNVDPHTGFANQLSSTPPDTGYRDVFSLFYFNSELYALTSDSRGGDLLLVDIQDGSVSELRRIAFSAR